MCGFAGVVQRDGRLPGDLRALADALGGSLAHRGPDGAGVWQAPGDTTGQVLLVHRRLAIIDPGPGGVQPMATPDGHFHIVFNGEVYNYRALREDLRSRGEHFVTGSDTEVLLRLVATGGVSRLADVRGMFAFACWDTVNRSLLLARDRFGIKPLYVAAGPGRLAFASELSALRASHLVTGEPSPAGVLAFLRWGSVPPPLTWLHGAEMLEPGTWRRWWLDGREERGAFADTRSVYVRSGSGRQVRSREIQSLRADAGAAVRESVRAHLVADVPVGVFLSGGIDSGALVSCATAIGAGNLQTFTVGFADTSSEIPRARAVARKFGTTHHELHVDPADVARDLPAVLARLDQPTIDAVNSFYVSRAVAATGIKAVLSGTGGDELFGGYPSFARLPRALAAKHVAGPFWPAVGSLARAFVPRRLTARWDHFAASNGSLIEAYRVQRGFLLPQEVAALAGPALCQPDQWREALQEVEAVERLLLLPLAPENPSAAVARLESRMYLGSQLLRDLDVMSMAHGLEVRVPFVDHVLLAQIWPRLARHSRLLSGKRLLADTLDHPLPDANVRHPKQGFTLPFARWIGGTLAPFVNDGMRRLSAAGWIGPAVPDRVWTDWRHGLAHWSRPWGLAVLGHFLGS
jgi:asparagine synthase (glutamine-hydrolysing)